MPGNFYKEDLRIIKTHKALYAALSTLLKQYRFSKITVYDICEEALVSRTAFYAHFKDKYDLLQKWLETIKSAFVTDMRDGQQNIERGICSALCLHEKTMRNLITDADEEQRQLLLVFFSLDTGNLSITNQACDCNKLLSDFFAGGMLNLLYAHVFARCALPEEETAKFVCRVYEMMRTLMNGGSENGSQR